MARFIKLHNSICDGELVVNVNKMNYFCKTTKFGNTTMVKTGDECLYVKESVEDVSKAIEDRITSVEYTKVKQYIIDSVFQITDRHFGEVTKETMEQIFDKLEEFLDE